VGSWGPDILGPGFQARTLPLLPDEEDDGAVATLVRHVPALDPHALAATPTTPSFSWLYLHGWNDYFFNTTLAREVARIGGAFYAVDLRRYGRSLREGQMLGWTANLTDYDEEIGQALAVVRAETGMDTPVVLCGHSTGGLTASLWADRHPGALAALVLNSPWLVIQGADPVRLVGEPVVNTLARRDPRRPVPLPSFPEESLFTVLSGWDVERDGELPDPAWEGDEYVRGWQVDHRWKVLPTAPVRPGWLQAVLAGQARVSAGLDVRCPVLCLASARSRLGVTWNEDARHVDTVLEVDEVVARAVRLGALVTVARFEGGVHDLMLSAPPVREQVLSVVRRWVAAYVLH